MLFVRIFVRIQGTLSIQESMQVVCLLPDMDRKTNSLRISFRSPTQAAQANQVENLEQEPTGFLPLSLSHQKECTGVY